MTNRLCLVSFFVACTLGCGVSSSPSPSRSYNGTASVGDFLTIGLDASSQTLTYRNLSNGDQGSVPYQVNRDGTYSLNDPAGNLVAAYEVPQYALLIQARKAGPNHDQPALITAVETGKISLATWAGHDFNYMQFRTSSGGMEVGSVSIDSLGDVSVTGYWPYGSIGQSSAFNVAGFAGSNFQPDPSGTFLKLADQNGAYDYVFGTENGVFAVDTPNGAILGFRKSSSKDFSPAFAGNYKAVYYQKTGALTGPGNVETGTPQVGNATLLISSGGQATIQDGNGFVVLTATLQPVADVPYLYGPAELQDPCYGVFTFRIITPNAQQDVFMTFMDRSVLFSTFTATLPWGAGNTYSYLYGVGLK
jgi:hypothetical protein